MRAVPLLAGRGKRPESRHSGDDVIGFQDHRLPEGPALRSAMRSRSRRGRWWSRWCSEEACDPHQVVGGLLRRWSRCDANGLRTLLVQGPTRHYPQRGGHLRGCVDLRRAGTRRCWRWVVLTAWLAACGPARSTSAGSSEASGAATEPEQTGGECSFESFECSPAITCGGALVQYLPDGECSVSASTVVSGDLTCIFTAFRDGVPGGFPVDTCGDECGQRDEVIILGDGTAVLERTNCPPNDVPPTTDRPRRVAVKPPDFFQTCLGTSDASLLVTCLTEWFEPASCVRGACCPVPNPQGLPPC